MSDSNLHIIGQSKQKNISHEQAVSIAVKVGQNVYDQVRAEHALSMEELRADLQQHFREIKTVVAGNILDLQRRSFSYRLRRDFEVDVQTAVTWLQGKIGGILVTQFGIYWPALPVVAPEVAASEPVSPFPTCDCDNPDGESCVECAGAVAPVVAGTLTLSSTPTPELIQ